jgi:hypothetical protein
MSWEKNSSVQFNHHAARGIAQLLEYGRVVVPPMGHYNIIVNIRASSAMPGPSTIQGISHRPASSACAGGILHDYYREAA